MAAGTLAERYERKRIFLIFTAAFGITSLICRVADHVSLLIAARYLHGMSGAAMLVGQIAVLSHDAQGGRERAVAWGWWGVIFNIGLGFDPIIGGATVAVSIWEWVFLIRVFFAAMAFLLTVAGVHEAKEPQTCSLDIAGMPTLSLAVFCLALYTTQGPDFGLGSPIGIAILSVAVRSFVDFLIAEKVGARPTFDFSVFRTRCFSGAIIGSLAITVRCRRPSDARQRLRMSNAVRRHRRLDHGCNQLPHLQRASCLAGESQCLD